MPAGRPLAIALENASGGAGMSALIRACRVIGLAALAGERPSETAKKIYGEHRAIEMILRAASSPSTLAGNAALAQITTAFLDVLTPASAGADLLGRGIRLNFAGAASITVPNIAIPNASFVGEGAPIPVKQGTTTPGPTLSPHKLASICVLTGELMRSSNAETMVKQVLIESAGPTVDLALFSTNAASATAPAGLLYNIVALTPAASGPTKGEILTDDVQKLASALGPVSGNGGIVLVASPDAAAALVLRLPAAVEWPILTSASLAPRTVIAVAANAVVSAVEGAPTIDARGEVAIAMADPALPIGDAGSTYVGSTFQTDEIALRLRWQISWALRDARGLSWMTNVNW
jgi:Phage capsid family